MTGGPKKDGARAGEVPAAGPIPDGRDANCAAAGGAAVERVQLGDKGAKGLRRGREVARGDAERAGSGAERGRAGGFGKEETGVYGHLRITRSQAVREATGIQVS